MTDVVTELILPKLGTVRRSGAGWQVKCPAHEDNQASLHIERGNTQPVVMTCHAGCERDVILDALGLTWKDLCNPRTDDDRPPQDAGEWMPGNQRASAVYDYVDETGTLLFQVLRSPSKDFRQRRPDPTAKSGWRWRLEDTRRVLYRLPKVIAAVNSGEIVYIVEGEKDVHTLEAHGATATCNPGGAGKWRDEYTQVFAEAIVCIIADADEPGRKHAREVLAALTGVARGVEVLEPLVGKDATDHLAAGKTIADFLITHESDLPSDPVLAPDLYEFLAEDDPAEVWVIPHLLERSDRLIWTGEEGLGKALALDTPIPTPKGWVTMGALSVGDEVFAADGSVTHVTAATPVMTGHDCYRVQFSDGATIVADADHQWLTETLNARNKAGNAARRAAGTAKRGVDQRGKRRAYPSVVTTRQIEATLKVRGGQATNHSVEVCAPLQYPAQELSIDPYVVGCWLGDGTSRHAEITSADDEIVERIRAAGEPIRHKGGYKWVLNDGVRSHHKPDCMRARLRRADLLANKHIPEEYLHASAPQRLALLQGLMDTDGSVTTDLVAPICEFSVTDKRLAQDVHELLLGFGIKVRFAAGPAVLNGRHVGTRYRLAFQTDLPVFRMSRKARRLAPLRTRRAKLRYITGVEPVPSVPVRCIEVDDPGHLYLAGRECIPTHNSMFTRQLAIAAAAGIHPLTDTVFAPQKVLFIDCENPVRKSRRQFRKLEQIARAKRRPVPDGGFRIIHKPAGVDLSRPDDRTWLIEQVTAHKPDLLLIGPLYKLHALDINEERAARTIVGVLDEARTKADCALVIEAHAPHGAEGQRALRPYGSSLFMRWPEFGYGIRIAPGTNQRPQTRKRVAVRSWRGPREERDWPRTLQWGSRPTDWPWILDRDDEAEAEWSPSRHAA